MSTIALRWRAASVAIALVGLTSSVATALAPGVLLSVLRAFESPGLELPAPGGPPIRMDVSRLRAALARLDESERLEQVADWAVYATLVQAGLPAETIRDATFDIAPLRHPAVSQALNFAIGRGRRVLLPDETVWLFRPNRDDLAKVTLARLADDVRTELGHIPQRVAVFRYQLDPPGTTLEVWREHDLEGEALFSAEYGYHEASVASLAELTDWLAKTDDLTHARLAAGSSVTLGGRRLAEARSPGLTGEAVATLYRAWGGRFQRPDRAPGFSLDTRWDAERLALRLSQMLGNPDPVFAEAGERLNVRSGAAHGAQAAHSSSQGEAWNLLLSTMHRGGDDHPKLSEAARAQIREAIDAVRGASGAAPEGVASAIGTAVRALERWLQLESHKVELARAGANDFEKLDRDADQVLDLREAAIMQRELFSALDSDSSRTLTPTEFAGVELREPAAPYWLQVLDFVVTISEQQCARYDSSLRGTRIGMNLFYTDLIAKLWSDIDYAGSAPVDVLHGFPSKARTGLGVAPTYWDEWRREKHARVWFGPSRDRWAVSDDASAQYFRRFVTRVYATSSRVGEPKGASSVRSEALNRMLRFWDRQLEQIADHEPQYHLQNQAAKWSVLLRWLITNKRFDFLEQVPSTDQSLRFDEWAASNPALRFQHRLAFVPAFAGGPNTECLERLQSGRFTVGGVTYRIEGGVTLIGEPARLGSSLPLHLRRHGLLYERSSTHTLELEHATHSLSRPDGEGAVHTTARTAAGVRLRVGAVDIEARELGQRLVRDAAGVAIQLAIDQRGLYTVVFRSNGKQLEGLASPGELEHAIRLAEIVSDFAAPIQELPPGSHVIQKLDGTRVAYLATMRDGALRFERFSLDHTPAHPAFLRAAVKDELALALGSVVDTERALQELRAAPHQRIRPGAGREPIVELTYATPPVDARPVSVYLSDGSSARAVTDGTTLYLERPTTASLVAEFHDLARDQAFTSDYVRRVSAGKPGNAASEVHTSHDAAVARRAVARASAGAYDGAIRELARATDADSFDRQLKGFLEQAKITALSSVPEGEELAVFDLVRGLGDASPEDVLLATLSSVRDSDVLRAKNLERLAELAAGARGAEVLARALAATRCRGAAQAICEFRQARRAELARGEPSTLKLERRGNTLVTEGSGPRTNRDLNGEADKAEALEDLATHGGHVYVEDSSYAAQYDWPTSPGRSVVEAAKNPRVVWRDRLGPPKDAPMPMIWREDGATYWRVDIPPAEPETESEDGEDLVGAPGIPYGGATIWLHARVPDRCDENGDGEIDDDERRRCAGP